MSTQRQPIQPVLLPSGFRDLLLQEAHQEEIAIRKFLETSRQLGYERVRPPLAEFEDALFAEGPGAFVKEQAFRFIDPISNKMMALRCDITTQIARIVSTRLKDAPRPLRLMYANDVLRTKGGAGRVDRQFCQAGCELISAPNLQADLEIAVLSLQSLHAMGVAAITIDLSYTRLLHLILDSYGITGDDRQQWLDMLASKDMAALEARPESFSQGLASVIAACGRPHGVLEALRALDLNEDAQTCVEELQTIAEGLDDALRLLSIPDVQISIDPFELQGFEYHSGVSFTLFTSKTSAEIGRGGRYDIQGGQSATGFTLYMDAVMRALPEAEASRSVYVPADVSWDVIKRLQGQGWIVKREIEGYDARALCSHEYKNGDITAIS